MGYCAIFGESGFWGSWATMMVLWKEETLPMFHWCPVSGSRRMMEREKGVKGFLFDWGDGDRDCTRGDWKPGLRMGLRIGLRVS